MPDWAIIGIVVVSPVWLYFAAKFISAGFHSGQVIGWMNAIKRLKEKEKGEKQNE